MWVAIAIVVLDQIVFLQFLSPEEDEKDVRVILM